METTLRTGKTISRIGKNNNINQQNWRPPNPNWQNQKPNWNQQRNNNTAQSSQKYCNYCNKFGHILSQWFRPQQHQLPAPPYTQYSAELHSPATYDAASADGTHHSNAAILVTPL